jgi:hypothetical protein
LLVAVGISDGTYYLHGYSIHISYTCTNKVYKKSEKITHVLLILFHRYIKFYVQTHYRLAIIKNKKFLTKLRV